MSHTYAAMASQMRRGGEPWAIEQGWLKRRWSRRGARNFLLACWAADYGSPRGYWEDIYSANIWAAGWARHLGFRIPSEAFDPDRARVLRLAAKANVHLARDYPNVYKWCMKVHR